MNVCKKIYNCIFMIYYHLPCSSSNGLLYELLQKRNKIKGTGSLIQILPEYTALFE